jgi:hypothetical protein
LRTQEGTIRRFRFFFKQNYWRGVALIDVLFWTLAALCSASNHPFAAGAFAGIGGSVLATILVSLAGPLGEEVYHSFLHLGVTRFWSDRSLVPKDQWVKWLAATQMRCTLLGHAHGEWCLDVGFEPALIERLNVGKTVEIFFLDPNGAGVALRQKEDRSGLKNTKARIRSSLRTVWDISQRLEDAARSRLGIYVYDCTPSLGVTWIDDWMLVTHYLAGSVNLTSPALLVKSQPDSKCLYAVYEANVTRIRDKFSTQVTKDNINTYTNE